MLIIRRSNFFNTASGIVFSVSDCPACGLRRNMYRITVIKVLYNVIVHQVGRLPTVVPGCTVRKKVKFTFCEVCRRVAIIRQGFVSRKSDPC